MAATLPGRRLHHACNVDSGAFAHADFLGGFLLPLCVSRHLHRPVRIGRGRPLFLCCGRSGREHFLPTGSPGGAEQPGRAGVARLYSDPQRRARQSYPGGSLFCQRASVLLLGRGGFHRRGGSHPAGGSRVFLRSVRRGRRLPAAGSVPGLFRRAQHGNCGFGFVRRIGGHLVQPGGYYARASGRCGSLR